MMNMILCVLMFFDTIIINLYLSTYVSFAESLNNVLQVFDFKKP